MKWLASIFGFSAGGTIWPYIIAGLLATHIGAGWYGYRQGKEIVTLRWQAAQAEALRERARIMTARDEAIARADDAEAARIEAETELAEKIRQEAADALAKNKADSTFCVDGDIGRLFDRETGRSDNNSAATDPRPCPPNVPAVPGSAGQD